MCQNETEFRIITADQHRIAQEFQQQLHEKEKTFQALRKKSLPWVFISPAYNEIIETITRYRSLLIEILYPEESFCPTSYGYVHMSWNIKILTSLQKSQEKLKKIKEEMLAKQKATATS